MRDYEINLDQPNYDEAGAHNLRAFRVADDHRMLVLFETGWRLWDLWRYKGTRVFWNSYLNGEIFSRAVLSNPLEQEGEHDNPGIYW